MDRSVFSAIDSIQSLIVLAIAALPAVAKAYASGKLALRRRRRALVISPSVTDLQIARSGRVPFELANQNAPSAHRVFRRPVSIWRRPSTKKPAFAAVSAEITRASDHLDGAVRLRPGGLTLRVRLNPNEDLDHFARSLKKHAHKGLRKIVIFPVQFHSSRPLRVLCVEVSVFGRKFNQDGIEYIDFAAISRQPQYRWIKPKSVKLQDMRLYLTNPNEAHVVQRQSLGEFYKLRQQAIRSGDQPDDPASRCEDYPLVNDLWLDRLARYYWMTVAALVWAMSLPIRGLLGAAVLLSLFAAVCGFLHGLRWFLYERGRTNWAGGTTACLHDGDVLRSGRGLWSDLF